MSRKRIRITLEEPKGCGWFDHNTMISRDEYKHLFVDHEVTDEELGEVLDIITTWFMQNPDNHTIIVDLNERNERLAPRKEMTIKEIEKELGYKIKIID